MAIREYILTQNQPGVHGEFWVPGQQERLLGVLSFVAARGPELELARFTGSGKSAFLEAMVQRSSSSRCEGHRVMHGIDDQGEPLTLIDCSESSSHATPARISKKVNCRAVIFGAHLGANDLSFSGLVLRLDHQDEWLNRSALGKLEHELDRSGDSASFKFFKVPISDQKSIDLGLNGYARSRFSLTWSLGHPNRGFSFGNRSYLDLEFTEPKTWDQMFGELQSWTWFLSMATRTRIGLEEVFLRRHDVRDYPDETKMKKLPVWIVRSVGTRIVNPKRRAHEFHFGFDDVENQFSRIFDRWCAMAVPWAAVLHRFVAVTLPRDLWINEQFLFLAQAIESLHRARTGKSANVEFLKAAGHAWDESPSELQVLLGSRDVFSSTLRSSRNYWTHYGKPGPEDNPEILSGDELIVFNEKLRWVVESAILREIGIPEENVARVWSERWRFHFVNFA